VQGLPAKQLELAREIVPSARKIAIVTDTSDIKATPQWDEINAAASKFEITLVGADARGPEDIDPAFRKFKTERVDVVIVLQASFLILDRAHIAAAAAANRLPTVCGYREHVETGGLISYGVNLEYCFRRAATYTQRHSSRRFTYRVPYQARTSHQPQNRQGARPHYSADAARPRRRGDRMM